MSAKYLLITHSQDKYCVPLVQSYLSKKGKIGIVMHSDAYGKQYYFSNGINAVIPSTFKFEDQYLDIKDIKAIWNRKYAAPYSFDRDLSLHNNPYLREAHLLFINFLNTSSAFSLDKYSVVQNAENKLKQLVLAQEAGLSVPPTIFSNQPEDIFRFIESQNDQVVVKMQGVLSWSMKGDSDFFYTQKIQSADLKDATVLSAYPMIYQKLIRKEYELRVIYIDGDCYSGKIPSLDENIIDWRIPGLHFNWEKGTLPDSTKKKLKTLMDRLHLKFGAIDMIKSIDDGHYYFLEVNPTGEWGMLQRDLDLPIARKIAETLIRYS